MPQNMKSSVRLRTVFVSAVVCQLFQTPYLRIVKVPKCFEHSSTIYIGKSCAGVASRIGATAYQPFLQKKRLNATLGWSLLVYPHLVK